MKEIYSREARYIVERLDINIYYKRKFLQQGSETMRIGWIKSTQVILCL